MNTIPCKRPRIDVIDKSTLGGASLFVAACWVPRCNWSYSNVVKGDVSQHASWHRAAHRAAVPKTRVYQLPAGPNFENRGYMAECDCGWYREAPGVTSRADNQAALDYHLSHDHGLVA